MLYKNLFSQGVENFDYFEDISVSNLALSFSSVGREFTISGAFKIHDYSYVEAKIVLSQTVISVAAALDNLKFDDVENEEASLDLFIGKKGSLSNKALELQSALLSKVKSGPLTISRTLLLYPSTKIPPQESFRGPFTACRKRVIAQGHSPRQ